MKKTRASLLFILWLLSVSSLAFAGIDNVLEVVPAGAIGLVYLPNLQNLSVEIDELAAQLVPDQAPQNLLAQGLAKLVGAGFSSLEDLAAVGVDVERDFAFFWDSPRLQKFAAVVHLLDRDTMETILLQEMGPGEPREYRGISYQKRPRGTTIFLEDVMIFCGEELTGRKVIDVYRDQQPSLTEDPQFASLKLDVTGETNDLVGYAAMDKIVAAAAPLLSMAVQGLEQQMEKGIQEFKQREQEQGPAEQPSPEVAAKLLKAEIELGLWWLQQLKSFGLSFALDGTDLDLRLLTQFLEQSPMREWFAQEPQEMELLRVLPANSFLVGDFRLSPEVMSQIGTELVKGFFRTWGGTSDERLQKAQNTMLELLQIGFNHFRGESAFALRFGTTLIPESVSVTRTDDASQALDQTITSLPKMAAIYEELGLTPAGMLWAPTNPQDVASYMGARIVAFDLPMQKPQDLPENAQGLIPDQLRLWYAAQGSYLVQGMGSEVTIVKEQLDALNGGGATFEQWLEETDLADRMPQKANWVVLLSPVAALKTGFAAASEQEPQLGMMAMMFENIPTKFSIIFSGTYLPQGSQCRLQIAAGDLRELISMVMMMRQM